MTANFVGAYYSSYSEEVLVWERDSSQEGSPRILKRYEAPYYFYVQDDKGDQTSLYGEKVKRLDFGSKAEFESALARYQTRKKFESDISPQEKVLMKHYYNVDAPPLHYTLLDIEVDYDKDLGFSSPENPYAPVNAITLYHQWKKEYVTIAIPPKSWQGQDWDELLDKTLPSNVTLVRNEKELLLETLDAIEDSDVISGWNSDFFDMPYLVKRTEMVLGKEAARRWSFRGTPAPRFEEVERFNEKRITVRIYGRTHLDFLQLFKKFAFGGRSSYALKSIADEELDIPKLEYDGSLENLYNTDFNFFLRYNIRDTEILDKLDEKFKYIELANEMTHANTITLDGAMGSVRLIDTGIINYCHYVRKVVVPDRNTKIGPTIEGALVLSPKIGLHEWIGSVDINSLYPSTMRSLNISPETIVGQFTRNPDVMKIDGEEDWKGIYARDNNLHVMYMEDGSYIEATGAEWYEMLKEKKWAISGFGTVFDQGKGQGAIPGLLTSWYAERKQLQKEKLKWSDEADKFEKGSKEYQHAKKMEEYYDKKQMVKKLLLNSLYGAVINQYDRFFDPRMGASTTATGRKITGHMISKISELLTGEYVDVVKTTDYDAMKKAGNEHEYGFNIYTSTSQAIIYSDTDSCYFKTFGQNKDEAILIADTIGEQVNESFIPFMQEAFLCQPQYDVLIKAGREVVADRGIFQAKKKYILRVVNLDGKDVKPGDKKELKVMGGEIKKSDTPKVIQKFLKETTMRILNGATYHEIETYVNQERKKFKTNTDILSIGVSRSVNKLEMYYDDYLKLEKTGIKKARLPGHVRASINFNEYLKEVGDKVSVPIKSGNKIKVFYLKPNDFRFESIAVPGDIDQLPHWFTRDFIVDIKKTEEKLIDMKLESIFDPLGWQVPTPQTARNNKLISWD
jgi:DNA polymerase elongation subunit (family B)